jgi:hypothetical protein
MHELAMRRLNDIIIVSYTYARHFKGERASLPSNAKWISIRPQPATYTASAVTIPGDSIWVREAQSSAEHTLLQTKRVAVQQPSLADAEPQRTISINVVAGDGFAYDRDVMLACLNTLQAATPHKLNISTQTPATYNVNPDSWTIWLDNVRPQTATPRSLLYSPCAADGLPALLPAVEAAVTCTGTPPTGWTLTKRLTPAIVLQENLVLTLAAILLPKTPTHEAATRDQRVLPELLIASTASQPNTPPKSSADTEASGYEYWTILITILIVAERWLAARRNQ